MLLDDLDDLDEVAEEGRDFTTAAPAPETVACNFWMKTLVFK